MSTNKDLLKQAIAEAKTIREAAIANAKEALEESLTPHLKEMLAQKLQEMEEEEDLPQSPTGGEYGGEFGTLEEAEEKDEEPTEEEEAPKEDGEEPTEDEGEEEDIKIEDMSVEELKDLIRDIVAQETGAEDKTGDDSEASDMTGTEDEEIDINELLRELEEGSHEDKMEEYGNSTMREPSDSAAAGAAELEKMIKAIAAKTGKTFDAISKFLYGGKSTSTPEMRGFRESAQDKEDLMEALKAVKILRSQLQEVNLLNAKLLYVNKVFKANNLTEGQKVNVVAAFDKAETVKEVKLVFETVSKNVVANQPARPAIKEHKSFASKPAGSTQKQVINEVSEAVNRMQILAGIKQREF